MGNQRAEDYKLGKCEDNSSTDYGEDRPNVGAGLDWWFRGAMLIIPATLCSVCFCGPVWQDRNGHKQELAIFTPEAIVGTCFFPSSLGFCFMFIGASIETAGAWGWFFGLFALSICVIGWSIGCVMAGVRGANFCGLYYFIANVFIKMNTPEVKAVQVGPVEAVNTEPVELCQTNETMIQPTPDKAPDSQALDSQAAAETQIKKQRTWIRPVTRSHPVVAIHFLNQLKEKRKAHAGKATEDPADAEAGKATEDPADAEAGAAAQSVQAAQ